MSVRSKFKVTKIERQMGSRPVDAGFSEGGTRNCTWEKCEIWTVVLVPVSSQDPASENFKFWNASPSGQIQIGCANKEAVEQFDLDKEYYVDFTLAE